MANHRADRRGQSQRHPSDFATPIATSTTTTVAMSVAGKRRAEKPGRKDRHPAVTVPTVLREDEATLVMAVTPAALVEASDPVNPYAVRDTSSATYQTSRITGVRAAAPRRTGPSQPGARRSASRAPLFRGLPSPPILLGLAALTIAAGGAVSAAGSLSTDEAPRFSQASALSGASDVASVSTLDRRVVSRDSERDARDDAAADKLVAKAESQVRERNAMLDDLSDQAEKQATKLRLNQWVLPLSGYRLTAEFGDYGLWSSYHTGLDFAAPTGTSIRAVANGVVTSAGYDGAYGNKTVITLDDGTELWFCHQTTFLVSAGQEVRAGETIGTVGSTGNVTGPHLHLEVRPGGGDPVDPYQALSVHGVTP